MHRIGIIIKAFSNLDIHTCAYRILEYLIFNKTFDVIILCRFHVKNNDWSDYFFFLINGWRILIKYWLISKYYKNGKRNSQISFSYS